MSAPLLHIPTQEEFLSMLRRHELKATRQRLAVHQAMMTLVHASPDMVCEELSRSGSAVTPASVYNILSQLADYHIYARRQSVAGTMFFDVCTERHFHLYDRENHTYRDVLDLDLAAEITSRLKRRKFKGFSVEDIDIQLIARPTRKKK